MKRLIFHHGLKPKSLEKQCLEVCYDFVIHDDVLTFILSSKGMQVMQNIVSQSVLCNRLKMFAKHPFGLEFNDSFFHPINIKKIQTVVLRHVLKNFQVSNLCKTSSDEEALKLSLLYRVLVPEVIHHYLCNIVCLPSCLANKLYMNSKWFQHQYEDSLYFMSCPGNGSCKK